MLSRVRIHVALLLLALCMLLAFVSLDVLFSWRHQQQKQLADSEAALRTEALRLKSIVETELGTNPQFAERMLMQLATLPDLQLAALIDDHGKVLMSTRFEARGHRATEAIAGFSDADLRNALSTGAPLVSAIDASHLGVLLSFGHVASGEDVVGHNDGVILLRSDLTRQRRDLRAELVGEIRTKTTLGLLFLLFFGGLLQSWIVGPIRALDGAAEAVARGERDAKIPAGGLQEVARLAQALTAMRNHLTHALGELSDLNRNLETIVVERTEAMRSALAQAEAASKAKAAFLASMSHEIRTPMNAIIGLSQLSLGLPLEPTARNYTEKVLRSAEHLLGVINNILDFSRIEAGKIQLEHTEFEPRGCIDNAMTFVAARALSKGLDLRVKMTPGIPVRLVGDPLRLSQILTNLLNNAVKFTETGHVHLRVIEGVAEVERRWLRFEVEDSGVGIPAEALPNLFMPFEQVDSSISRRYGGSGLGLAISRQLAEQMGGRIGVHSSPGAGSLFFVEIPFGRCAAAEGAADAAAVPEWGDPSSQSRRRLSGLPEGQGEAPAGLSPPPSLPLPEQAPDLSGVHVLVAEDNEINQELAVSLLRRSGADIQVVGNGAEAVQAVASGTFDVVLMDVQMPLVSGIEATQRIRALAGVRQPVIIAVTANALNGDRERCLQAGMDHYLSKPINASQLFRLLSGLGLTGIALVPGAAAQGAEAAYSWVDRLQSAGVEVEAAIERMMGNRELYLKLARRFVAERQSWCRDFEAALAAGDAAAAAAMAHSAKSLAGLLGLVDLQQRLGQFEADAAAGLDGHGLVPGIVKGFGDALALFDDCLRELEVVASERAHGN